MRTSGFKSDIHHPEFLQGQIFIFDLAVFIKYQIKNRADGLGITWILSMWTRLVSSRPSIL